LPSPLPYHHPADPPLIVNSPSILNIYKFRKSTLEFFRSTENTPQIAVDAASVTIYECRSLERLIFEQIVPFQGIKNSQGPIPEEKERVKLLIGEADEPNYYEAVIKPGNRTVHYRDDAVGATLVHPLLMTPVRGYPVRAALKERGMREIDDRHRLIEAIEIFRQRVDGALPGLYTWFDDTSLHITLRSNFSPRTSRAGSSI